MRSILYFKASEKRSAQMKYQGVCRAARAYGWRIQSVDATEGRYRDPAALLTFWHSDGAIVDCGDLAAPPLCTSFGAAPVVFLGRLAAPRERLFTVCEDLAATAHAAARELLALGYAHYGFVGSPTPRPWSDARGRAFRDDIALHGKPFSDFVATTRATRGLLGWTRRLRAWLARRPRPCGLFAANDAVALRVLEACSAENLRVPQDIAILGVDNDETLCRNATPPLSSVLSDFERAGYLAARLLAARFHSPHMKPVTRTFPPLMTVRRESTRAHRPQGTFAEAACALIRAKACEGLRARDVIALFHGSRRLAEIRFREATGHSILDEIQAVRLDRAQEMLADTTRPVKAIANLCGYASERAFRTVYRAAFGTAPRTRKVSGPL